MNQDLAILGVPLSMVAFALLSLWNTRRRVLRHAAEREVRRQAERGTGDKPGCCECKCKGAGS